MKPNYQELIVREFERTDAPVSTIKLADKLGIHPRLLRLNMPIGWKGKKGHKGGYAPISFWESQKALRKLPKNSPQPSEEGMNTTLVSSVINNNDIQIQNNLDLAKEAYYREIHRLWENLRSASKDPELEIFHDEIEQFKNHTRHHLVILMNNL